MPRLWGDVDLGGISGDGSALGSPAGSDSCSPLGASLSSLLCPGRVQLWHLALGRPCGVGTAEAVGCPGAGDLTSASLAPGDLTAPVAGPHPLVSPPLPEGVAGGHSAWVSLKCLPDPPVPVPAASLPSCTGAIAAETGPLPQAQPGTGSPLTALQYRPFKTPCIIRRGGAHLLSWHSGG